MHWLVIAAVLILALAGLVLALERRRHGSRTAGDGGGQGAAALREAVLSRQLFAQRPIDESGQLHCALMDWHLGSGVATLAAFDDGTVSLYFNTGGGVIGGGAHDVVRRAATDFRSAIDAVRGRFEAAATSPLPAAGQATFWAVTGDRTLSSGPIAVARLQDPSFWLTPAGQAAQATISRLREVSA